MASKFDPEKDNIFGEGWCILPKKVMYDKEVCSSAKLLYCEISSLCAQRGYCWATNAYFSEVFGVNSNTISAWMTSLERYLIIENRSSHKRKIFVHTLNSNASLEPHEKGVGSSRKNSRNPTKNREHNSINNSINEKELSVPSEHKPPKEINLLIETWNGIAGRCGASQHKNPDTKVYEKCIILFKHLRAGSFKDPSKFLIKDDFLKRNKIAKELLSKRWTDKEIEENIKRLEGFYTIGNWPQDKSKLPKDLATFIYNERTGTSFFFMAAAQEPKPLADSIIVKDLHPEITEKYRPLYKHLISSQSDENFFIKNINEIFIWHNNISERLKGYSQPNGGFDTWFKLNAFVRAHIEWLQARDRKVLMELSPTSYSFKAFKQNFEIHHGYKLNPTDKEIERSKELSRKQTISDKEWEEKKKRKIAMEEAGIYIKEEESENSCEVKPEDMIGYQEMMRKAK